MSPVCESKSLCEAVLSQPCECETTARCNAISIQSRTKRWWRATAVSALLIALGGCATLRGADSRQDDVPESVAKLMQAAQIPREALGGVVLRQSDGKTLWASHATRAMQPASTIKVLSSIVALETLKPSYRAKTLLVTAAPQRGDTLDGDLALIGRGNDELSIASLEAMLRTLRAQGVMRIAGDIVLDREFFQPPRPYEGVAPFDESPEFRYNVIPDALMLGSNLNQLALSSNDSELRIVFGPPMQGVEFVSGMTLIEQPCELWENKWKIPHVEKKTDGTIRVTLLGEYPKNCNANTEINVLARTDYAERAIAAAWRALGGTWSGRAREGVAPTGSNVRTIATQDSRTLAEINRDINKRSDNAMTRSAFLSIAATKSDLANPLDTHERLQSSFARSDRIVRDWLKANGIDDTGLVLENGSGLSRNEMIAPMTLAQTLRAAHASPWASEFMMSLPIVGVDGAMRNRMKDSIAVERGRMKTGGLRNVTSVAGYLPNAKGETMIVVLFLNHDNARGARARAVLDELMRELMR
jgi:serine-type D-Ala-D-Ala carboxypeptidase/endopeptidase (penicillin-binding protein 4)